MSSIIDIDVSAPDEHRDPTVVHSDEIEKIVRDAQARGTLKPSEYDKILRIWADAIAGELRQAEREAAEALEREAERKQAEREAAEAAEQAEIERLVTFGVK